MALGGKRSDRRRVLLAIAAGALMFAVFLTPSRASAAPSLLAVDTLTPELKAAEAGGGSKVELSFINLTDGPALLRAEELGQPKCATEVKESQLKPNLITPVTVEIPKKDCETGEGLQLELTGTLEGGASQEFKVEPKGAPAATPDWHELWAFLATLAIGLALTAGVFARWRKLKLKELHRLTHLGAAVERLREPLRSLDATWSFNDNWATNATAAGALLTGLFSATTAKAFLGENAEALTALATVGAAIALVLVGAAPIVALATKSYKPDGGTRGDSFTVGGVLLAATLILAGAVGQLWVVAYTASELHLGGLGFLVWVTFGLALILLALYSWRTLDDVLERGTGTDAPDPPKEGIEAATLIANAIKACASEDAGEERFADLESQIDAASEAGREYRRRTRSALL